MIRQERTVKQAVAGLQRFLELAPAAAGTCEERDLPENIRILISALRLEQQRLKAIRSEVETLRRLLPICMYCKKIRDDDGDWNKLERAVSAYGIYFSHTICPDCLAENHPEADGCRLHLLEQGSRY